MAKLLLVLGNGFTIDFLQHLKKREEIDVINLFRLGCEVAWPATKNPGFLSFRHCPNLWNLGARPNMDPAAAIDLIEDIITCANVYAAHRVQNKIELGKDYRPNDIYIYAYQELSQYLKHLFVHYNHMIPELTSSIEQWSWYKFLKHHNGNTKFSEINIVTYNYDIWLERTLEYAGVPFNISCVGEQDRSAKVTIYKPHGSISFLHKEKLDNDSFEIKRDKELSDGLARDFEITYTDMEQHSLVTALIPPAGDSGSFNHSWANEIRIAAKGKAKQLTAQDEIIICGNSYWHVDRAELDELITSCDKDIPLSMINPSPKRTMNAVLTSIFSNFTAYTHSRILEKKL